MSETDTNGQPRRVVTVDEMKQIVDRYERAKAAMIAAQAEWQEVTAVLAYHNITP